MSFEEKEIVPIISEGELSVPVLDGMVPAGFPSPLQGMAQESIDLNRELISHPASTFCARVSGNSMIDSGINDGDLLLIDKSVDVRDGAIAVCFIDGEFTLKRISIRGDGVYLVPSNPDYPEIRVNEEANFQVWGIVTYVVKSMGR